MKFRRKILEGKSVPCWADTLSLFNRRNESRYDKRIHQITVATPYIPHV